MEFPGGLLIKQQTLGIPFVQSLPDGRPSIFPAAAGRERFGPGCACLSRNRTRLAFSEFPF
jgi:hypothetical protein